MVLADTRQTLRTIAGIVTLFVLAAPCQIVAQRDSPPAAEDAEQALVAAIDAIHSQRGGNAPALVEPLTALSWLYEERGDYALALAFIEATTQVIEVNYGLHTLDEAQLMSRSIRIQRARGNAEAAWNEEQALLRLIRRRRHQADARTIPLLHAIADERRAILARYRSGEFPPEIVLGCYYSEWAYDGSGNPRRTGCGAGSKQTVIRALREEAFRYDAEAEAVAGRLVRWAELPCEQPAASTMAHERRSNLPTKEALQAYFRAVSDYAGCTTVKYEQAASTNTAPQELARLAFERKAAAAELAAQAAMYNERFGR